MKTFTVQRDTDTLGGALALSGTRVPVQALCDDLEGSSFRRIARRSRGSKRWASSRKLKRHSAMRLLLDECLPKSEAGTGSVNKLKAFGSNNTTRKR